MQAAVFSVRGGEWRGFKIYNELIPCSNTVLPHLWRHLVLLHDALGQQRGQVLGQEALLVDGIRVVAILR